MAEYYLYIKSVHIIFVVCWMAALFYIVRLFIYHTEAQAKPEPDRAILSEQFNIMERKLWYIIAVPSMLITIIAGGLMLYINPGLFKEGWMHIKLAFVGALIVYHHICQSKIKQMQNGIYNWTSTQLRLWNELATLFLFAIVFLVVLRNSLNWIFGVVGIIAFSIIIMCAVKIYKHFREKN